MPGDLASMVTPQLIQAVAAKLGMQPQELIQQVQANPQIAQQIMQMMGGSEGGTAGTDDAGWMDKAASKQAAPPAAAPTTEAPPMENYK